ncbi:hypothetical protein [Pseudobutyrivibrio sp. MD2005]|uniref:hypothetical protein n=1 Tax=Pseudobutyrivibrio sp. MD2005 TaxID=1410616 RepID=UPI000486A937|nr:hypothetical protein [Pseudobutyrivibrio sp. MD2005]
MTSSVSLPVGALGAGTAAYGIEFVDEALVDPTIRYNVLNDENAYKNVDLEQVAINAGITSGFTTFSRRDKAVFWSGDLNAAINYAESIDGVVMEITPGGKVLNGWETLNDVYPPYKWGTGDVFDQKPIWEAMSRKYAHGATGEVTYVHPNDYYGNVWKNTEEPVLLYRKIMGYVTKINEVEINGK